MTSTLLDQFLAEECTREIRGLIQTGLEDGIRGTGPRKRRFEFNRFELMLDFDSGEVLLEDVLDAGDSGAQRIPIAEFTAAIEERWR